MIITQKTLKEYLNYNDNSGVFTWKKKPSIAVNVGDVAGCIRVAGGKSYVRIRLKGKAYSSHRLAFLYMTGKFPHGEVDHIDGNGRNNSWLNLRDVSHVENNRNKKLFINNKSGITGVFWYKSRNKWKAHIRVNWNLVFLGHFDCLLDACCARKSAELKYGFHENHGEDRPLY